VIAWSMVWPVSAERRPLISNAPAGDAPQTIWGVWLVVPAGEIGKRDRRHPARPRRALSRHIRARSVGRTLSRPRCIRAWANHGYFDVLAAFRGTNIRCGKKAAKFGQGVVRLVGFLQWAREAWIERRSNGQKRRPPHEGYCGRQRTRELHHAGGVNRLIICPASGRREPCRRGGVSVQLHNRILIASTPHDGAAKILPTGPVQLAVRLNRNASSIRPFRASSATSIPTEWLVALVAPYLAAWPASWRLLPDSSSWKLRPIEMRIQTTVWRRRRARPGAVREARAPELSLPAQLRTL
jgi:hypothetical protein